MNRQPLILASASPRRHEILSRFGINHIIHPAIVMEPHPDELCQPEQFCMNSATVKAESLRERFPERMILGADTIVVLDGLILGKPATEAESETMIRRLSGQTHQVITGICLIIPGQKPRIDCEITTVTFRELDDAEIHWYISSRDGMDKAGAYGIQSLAGCLIRSIHGDWFNVVGLPVHRLISWLKAISGDLWPPSSDSD